MFGDAGVPQKRKETKKKLSRAGPAKAVLVYTNILSLTTSSVVRQRPVTSIAVLQHYHQGKMCANQSVLIQLRSVSEQCKQPRQTIAA